MTDHQKVGKQELHIPSYSICFSYLYRAKQFEQRYMDEELSQSAIQKEMICTHIVYGLPLSPYTYLDSSTQACSLRIISSCGIPSRNGWKNIP